MLKNEGIRITVDGQMDGSDKTIMVHAFAEFLREKGFRNVEVMAEHPANIKLGLAATQDLEDLASSRELDEGGMYLRDKQIVIVERSVPADAGWEPKPHTHVKLIASRAHLNLEMGLVAAQPFGKTDVLEDFSFPVYDPKDVTKNIAPPDLYDDLAYLIPFPICGYADWPSPIDASSLAPNKEAQKPLEHDPENSILGTKSFDGVNARRPNVTPPNIEDGLTAQVGDESTPLFDPKLIPAVQETAQKVGRGMTRFIYAVDDSPFFPAGEEPNKENKMNTAGIRVTIDGGCYTGKTILMSALAALLEQCGIPADQVVQLNDSHEDARLKGPEAIEFLKNAIANGLWKNNKIVFVERVVPRHMLSENDGYWNAMPEPAMCNARGLPRSQVSFEMTNQPSKTVRIPDELLATLKLTGITDAIQKVVSGTVVLGSDLQHWLQAHDVKFNVEKPAAKE